MSEQRLLQLLSEIITECECNVIEASKEYKTEEVKEALYKIVGAKTLIRKILDSTD